MSNNNIKEGIGSIKNLVDLEQFYKEKVGDSDYLNEINFYKDEYCCNRCGYDRGIEITHTEIQEAKVHCDNCETLLFDTAGGKE